MLPEIYVARVVGLKEHSKLVFRMVEIAEEQAGLMPRKFCSAYELYDQDKIFIFGGFYEKEYNYLYKQADITGLDLRHYDDHNRKCIVTNEKGAMYSRINEGN